VEIQAGRKQKSARHKLIYRGRDVRRNLGPEIFALIEGWILGRRSPRASCKPVGASLRAETKGLPLARSENNGFPSPAGIGILILFFS
jgi:hypothetical protein